MKNYHSKIKTPKEIKEEEKELIRKIEKYLENQKKIEKWKI